jgi:hypothetical protein
MVRTVGSIRTRRWHRRTAAVALVLAGTAVGCQPAPTEQVQMSLTQTPPTVQAAFNEYHPGAVIRSVTRDTRGDEHYYTVDYDGPDGSNHDVVYNGGGNEIDKH